MMGPRQWIALGCLCAATAPGCSNYRDDLDRSASHYNRNQYENAVALLQPLELDLDSLSAGERAQYAYYRGMSHFRLNQPREARHWLGVAAAEVKANEGALGAEELKRVTDTLDQLNRKVYGLAETAAPGEKSCTADADCDKGQFCDSGHCAVAPGEPAEAAETAPASGAPAAGDKTPGACGSDADCPGDQVCTDEGCVAP